MTARATVGEDGRVAATPTVYGLNLPSTTGRVTTGTGTGERRRAPPPKAFGFDDDEDEDEDDDDPIKARARANAEIARQQEHLAKRRARDAEDARARESEALKEDENAFEYDAVYDEIEASRGKAAQGVRDERVERKSRYIEDLMAKAAARKKESDASYERRLLKERLKEDHLYADKDKFVTAAYRAKLQEDAKWLSVEKARDAIEDEEDVTKRGSGAMTAFYSNLHKNAAFGGGDAAKPSTSKGELASQSKLTSAAERDREIIARAEAAAAAMPPPAIPEGTTLVERPQDKASLKDRSAADTEEASRGSASAKRTSETEISDARARYLERKRKAMAGGA